jgi:hypothetical protein
VIIQQAARLAAVMLLLVAASPASAAGCAIPEDCIKQVFSMYVGKRNPKLNLASLFDPDVRKLMKRAKPAEYDFFIQGQDFQISGLRISKAQFKGDRARVAVEFRNFDKPNRMVYEFVQQGDRWFITEIRAKEETYRGYLQNR